MVAQKRRFAGNVAGIFYKMKRPGVEAPVYDNDK
jgi:hypothetical protein